MSCTLNVLGGLSRGKRHVVPTVRHPGVVDPYGGVTVFQFFFQVRDPTFELPILAWSSIIVMDTSIIHKHLLMTLLPVKQDISDVLFAAESTGQNGSAPFFHDHFSECGH